MTVRVLVCGGRDYADTMRVWGTLKYYHSQQPFSVLIHGAASGADTLAKEWAEAAGVPVLPFRAAWDDLTTEPVVLRHRRDGTPYNAAAGHIRNQRMLDEGRPDVVVAFPGGKGTQDMIGRARRALGEDRVLVIAP